MTAEGSQTLHSGNGSGKSVYIPGFEPFASHARVTDLGPVSVCMLLVSVKEGEEVRWKKQQE